MFTFPSGEELMRERGEPVASLEVCVLVLKLEMLFTDKVVGHSAIIPFRREGEFAREYFLKSVADPVVGFRDEIVSEGRGG